jgi:hypothetical protein
MHLPAFASFFLDIASGHPRSVTSFTPERAEALCAHIMRGISYAIYSMAADFRREKRWAASPIRTTQDVEIADRDTTAHRRGIHKRDGREKSVSPG